MELIAIISLIAAILQIILFFKIWGMTNNIKALKKYHLNENVFETKLEMARYIRTNMILGNTENVKKILLKNFIENVEHGFGEMPTNGSVKIEKNFDEPITPYVDKLILQFAKIGEEVPAYITKMKTYRDYYRLFTKEDLKAY